MRIGRVDHLHQRHFCRHPLASIHLGDVHQILVDRTVKIDRDGASGGLIGIVGELLLLLKNSLETLVTGLVVIW